MCNRPLAWFALQISWCVARTTSLSSSSNPVPFPKVLVNQGSAWNASTHQVSAPRTGYYYLHISQGVTQDQSMVYMRILGLPALMSLFREPTSNNGIDTLSRSAILHIRSGTVITIRINNGCYSDSLMQTSFSGFLLYET